MGMRLALLIGATVVITAAATAALVRDALEDEPVDENASRFTVRSGILNEDRDYTIRLPGSYASDSRRRYPVLYVLDGQSQAGHTADSAALMARIDAMPEIIVVGVSSMDGETRNRDYTPPGMRLDTDRPGGETGAGDRFLAFFRDELIPAVERGHRTMRPRMLAGWSRGGLFVTWSLIAEPQLFDARFAHSPALWRENDLIVTQLEGALSRDVTDGGFLFLSLGAEENEKMKGAFAHAVEMLERLRSPKLRWQTTVTDGAVHETNARLATPVGLCGFFAAPPEPGGPACPNARDRAAHSPEAESASRDCCDH